MPNMPLIYEMSVPIWLRSLRNLEVFLKKGEKWCEDNNVPKKKLLEGRIVEDMQVCHSPPNSTPDRLG